MNEMTAKEAIKWLKDIERSFPEAYFREWRKALDLAMKALEPKPMEKFDDVKTHIQRLAGDYKCWDNRLTWEEALELNRMLEAQPNSNEFFNFDAPIVKNSEAVSRKEVNTLIDELARAISDERIGISRGRSTATIMRDILHLPSVTPQRPKGRWIEYKVDIAPHPLHCSLCGFGNHHISNRYMREFIRCPNCGAEMSGSEESEE